MRKSRKKSNTEQTIEDILNVAGIDATDEEETESEAQKKEEKDDEFDKNGIVVVIERIEHGLIGSLLIKDSTINKPLIKPGDYVHFRAYAKLLPKDIILYKDHDDYFIRRIIKFEDDEIWCAGDNERHFRIIHKDNVVAKALGRIRGKKFLSFGLENFSYKCYSIRKAYLNGIRLANRVMTFDQETNSEAFEAAMQNFEQQQAIQAQQTNQEQEAYKIAADIDLESDLADFLNPDDLVLELRGQNQEMVEEEVYLDSEGNEITKEEYEAYLAQQEENTLEDSADTEENTQENNNEANENSEALENSEENSDASNENTEDTTNVEANESTEEANTENEEEANEENSSNETVEEPKDASDLNQE